MAVLLPISRPENVLFWTAPVADSEFTPEDPLALDYLAQQVGNALLPALTTRTTRAQSFAVVLYGLQLAERALSVYGLPDDDEVRRRLFERWERFWALAVMESRQGAVSRGDPDAMRGVRGAVRAWFPGEKPLPLDYPLISRQLELGSLGAYLAPLRAAHLVVPGTLRASPAAEELLAAFWSEPDENSHASRYEEYAMTALDLARTRIERRHRNLTLATVGERSRLSSLYGKRARPAQQKRLYESLFERARDGTTLAMANLVEAAALAGVFDTTEILDGALDGRFGTLDSPLVDLLLTARRFGDVMESLLHAFDRAYVALDQAGWQAARSTIAEKAFPEDTLERLCIASENLLAAPEIGRIQRLPLHGPGFLRLLDDLKTASADEALERMLVYHLAVQRDRHRGDAWIRDQSGHLVLQLTTYNARPAAKRYPSFKLGVARQLLMDVGRLPQRADAETEEASA